MYNFEKILHYIFKWRIQQKNTTYYNIYIHTNTCTVRKKNIWSPADFVHLPTYKEMISLSF